MLWINPLFSECYCIYLGLSTVEHFFQSSGIYSRIPANTTVVGALVTTRYSIASIHWGLMAVGRSLEVVACTSFMLK